MMKEKERRIQNISGITCLMLTLVSCVVSFATNNYYMHALFVVWLCVLFIYFGLFKQSIIYLLIYAFTIVWMLEMVPRGVTIVSPMLLGMIYKLILPIMAGYLTFKIPSGKFIAVFQKSVLPQSIILILIVIVRFIPTISGEFRTIREAMKVRGFTGSLSKVLLHPLQTMEYAVVPLIFRSIKVGDELAAASIVRGIENPNKKHSYYSTRLHVIDGIIMLTSVCLLVLSFVL